METLIAADGRQFSLEFVLLMHKAFLLKRSGGAPAVAPPAMSPPCKLVFGKDLDQIVKDLGDSKGCRLPEDKPHSGSRVGGSWSQFRDARRYSPAEVMPSASYLPGLVSCVPGVPVGVCRPSCTDLSCTAAAFSPEYVELKRSEPSMKRLYTEVASLVTQGRSHPPGLVNCPLQIPVNIPTAARVATKTIQESSEKGTSEVEIKGCVPEAEEAVSSTQEPDRVTCPREVPGINSSPVNTPVSKSPITTVHRDTEPRRSEEGCKRVKAEVAATGNTPLHDLLNYLKKIIVSKSCSSTTSGDDTATSIHRGSMVPRKPEMGVKRSHTKEVPDDGGDCLAKFLKEDTSPEAEGGTKKTEGTGRKILGDNPPQGPKKQITQEFLSAQFDTKKGSLLERGAEFQASGPGVVHTAETKESQTQEMNQTHTKQMHEGKKLQVKKEFEEGDELQDKHNLQKTWTLVKEHLQEIRPLQNKAILQEAGQCQGKGGLQETRQLQSKSNTHVPNEGNQQEMRQPQDEGNLQEAGKTGTQQYLQEVGKLQHLEKLQQMGQRQEREKPQDQRNLQEAEKQQNVKKLKEMKQQQKVNKLQDKESLQEAEEHPDKEKLQQKRQLYTVDKLQEKETVHKTVKVQDRVDQQETVKLPNVERQPKAELEDEENLQEMGQLQNLQKPDKPQEANTLQDRDKVQRRKLQKQGMRQWEAKTLQEQENRKLQEQRTGKPQEKANLFSWQRLPSWLDTQTSREVEELDHPGKSNGNVHIKGLMKLMQDVLVSETGHCRETMQEITAEAGEMQYVEKRFMRPPQIFYSNDDSACPQDLTESIVGSGDSVLSDDTSWSLENVDSSYSALIGMEKVVSDFAETGSVSPFIVVKNPTTDSMQETCGKRKCSRVEADETSSQYLYLREEMNCFPEPADFSYSALGGLQKVVNEFAENGFFGQFSTVSASASSNTQDISVKTKSQRLKADLCHASPRVSIDSTNNPPQRLRTQAVQCGLSNSSFLPEWSSNTTGLQNSFLSEELNWAENVDSSYSALIGMEKVVSDFAETGSVSPLIVVKTPTSDRVQETSVKNKSDRTETGLCQASPRQLASNANDIHHRQHIQTVLYTPPGIVDSSYSALSGMEKVVSDFAETGSVSRFTTVNTPASDRVQEANVRNKCDTVQADICPTSRHMAHGSSNPHQRQQTAEGQGLPAGTGKKTYHGQECEPSMQCIDLTLEGGMPCRTDKTSVLASKKRNPSMDKRNPSADNRKVDSSCDHGSNEHFIDLTEEEDASYEMGNANPLRLAPANKERNSSNGGRICASDVSTQYIDLTKEDVESDPDRNKPLDPGSVDQEGHGPAYGVSPVNKHLSGLEKLLQEMPALVFKDPTSSSSRYERRETWWYKSSSNRETWENQRDICKKDNNFPSQ
ncbi:uncharacterized protein LOC115466151 [Microcaecilia unicolor]|uniref:Uncharacterized protein LOC115466151 n=1 Tax=Microcaecilia unicolor TaxID=1415580 RepID=A0A6P7XRQ3_9AMPH|nr:uncharacterized protein LOC115466151 [Microcaecilia unicolor]